MTKPRPTYELGHSDVELVRLRRQAEMLVPITRRFFVEAGIRPGMRVLDVGSGMGDVAFLAADIVGDGGEVVGTDVVSTAVTAASARREELGLRQVNFRECDPTQTTFDCPFDAVIGRYVLQWQGDPVAMLRGIARHVRPGGVIVFHELDWAGARSSPPCPTYDRAFRWMAETLRKSSIEHCMGTKMDRAYREAGLPAPSMRLECLIAGPKDPSGTLDAIAHTYLPESMVPAIVRHGVATADEVRIETFPDRMMAEAVANDSVIVGRWEIGAWSRV